MTAFFLDNDFQPFSDQWAYLSSIKKFTLKEVEELVADAVSERSVLCVKTSTLEQDNFKTPGLCHPLGLRSNLSQTTLTDRYWLLPSGLVHGFGSPH
jgi:hypothetical protein